MFLPVRIIKTFNVAVLLFTFSCAKSPGPDAPSENNKHEEDAPSTAHTDDAKGEGADCGGIAGLSCKDGFFCLYSLEATCGAADQTGKCATFPEACTMDYSPVCGCDDKTYSNACSAHSKGVSVASEGECAAP